MSSLTVVKRSGKKQAFTLRKIMTSVIKAGGTVELASDVVQSAWSWLLKKKEIQSTKNIKLFVTRKLKKINTKLARSYQKG